MTILAGQKWHASDGNRNGCRYETVGQTLTTAADQAVQFPTAAKTTTMVTASGTGNNTFTLNAPVLGWWGIDFGISWGNQSSAPYFYLTEGSSLPGSQIGGFNWPAAMTFGVWSGSQRIYVSPGQAVRCGFSGNGVSVVTNNDHRTFFSAVWLGPDGG